MQINTSALWIQSGEKKERGRGGGALFGGVDRLAPAEELDGWETLDSKFLSQGAMCVRIYLSVRNQCQPFYACTLGRVHVGVKTARHGSEGLVAVVHGRMGLKVWNN